MENRDKLAFTKANYIIMIIGIAVLAVGYFIMTLDKEDYGFGFLGITFGPVIVVVGYVIEFFAIFYKSKK